MGARPTDQVTIKVIKQIRGSRPTSDTYRLILGNIVFNTLLTVSGETVKPGMVELAGDGVVVEVPQSGAVQCSCSRKNTPTPSMERATQNSERRSSSLLPARSTTSTVIKVPST